MSRLTIEVDILTFADDVPDEDIRQALSRSSTHNPFDEIEGHLWSELHERGIDSMVTVEDWSIE